MAMPSQGRLFCGHAPVRSATLNNDFARDAVVFCVGDQSSRAAPLVHVRGNDTFLANGSWRETDSSAEFLCHSVAVEQPGQGSLRLMLPELARPSLPVVGQVVGRQYRILKILGEGEDAVVYLACHTEENVEYVLKAFREPRETFDQRRTEFEALRRISHPNIPRVHEIQGWEDPFHLRLDYVAGVPLEAKRAEFAGNLEAVATLGVAVDSALAAIHRAGSSTATLLPPTSSFLTIRTSRSDFSISIR
jgi:serine/threonine protein kinase